MSFQKKTGTVVVAGAAGAAAGEAFVSLEGARKVYAVLVDYEGQPETCDVTVADPQSGAVFARSNAAGDAMIYPRAAAAKASDGSASTLTEVAPVAESLQVKVAQGSAGTVKVTAYVE